MCLIIYAPNLKTARIRKVLLERAFYRHNDGAGLAYIKDGDVVVSRGYMTFDRFFLAFQQARSDVLANGKTGPLLVHFRRKTCGPANYVNTQPLTIYRRRLVMAHNGVFESLSEEGQAVSDSVRLSQTIRKLGWNFPFVKGQVEMLEVMCRERSKLVFLDNKGRALIVNEPLGKWCRGAWYSDGGDLFDLPTRQKWPKMEKVSNDHVDQTASEPTRFPFIKRPDVPTTLKREDMSDTQRAEHDAWMDYMRSTDAAFPATGPRQSNLSGFRKRSLVDHRAAATNMHQTIDVDLLPEDAWRALSS